mgnify:CR=1 FL=1
MNRLEPVIEHHVELGREIASFQVSNQSNVLGVLWGGSNILSSTGPGLPFRNFASGGCESGFQDINWAAPSVGVSEHLVITESGREDFHGSDAIELTGHVVEEMGCVSERQRPERIVLFFGPMQGSVNHQCSGF